MLQKVPAFGMFNVMVPKKGPKIIPLMLDFRVATSQEIDLTSDQMLDIMEMVQGIFIDNSGSLQPIQVEVPASQQILKIAAGQQGLLPVFCPNPPKLIVRSNGGTIIPVILYNVPLPAAVWAGGSNASFNFDAQGRLIVSDPILEALIANEGLGNALNVNVIGTGGPALLPGDAVANPALATLNQALGMQYNGTTWERRRGNTEAQGIASANRASGTNVSSGDITVYNSKSINIITNISATAGGNVTVKLQMRDPVSLLYVDVPGAITTALAGVSVNLLQIGPGITPAANLAVAANLGRTIRIFMTTGGGLNITNSVGYQLIN